MSLSSSFSFSFVLCQLQQGPRPEEGHLVLHPNHPGRLLGQRLMAPVVGRRLRLHLLGRLGLVLHRVVRRPADKSVGTPEHQLTFEKLILVQGVTRASMAGAGTPPWISAGSTVIVSGGRTTRWRSRCTSPRRGGHKLTVSRADIAGAGATTCSNCFYGRARSHTGMAGIGAPFGRSSFCETTRYTFTSWSGPQGET